MSLPHGLLDIIKLKLFTFIRDEDGSATIWCLLWLLLFVGIAGLSIDSTNGWRNKTMLQSTADVAALAGAWDLPNPRRSIAYAEDGYDDVKVSAIEFAHRNMGMTPDRFGSYLLNDGDGIQIGHWDLDNRIWTAGPDTDPDTAPVNAVRVNLYQYAERGNPVATTLLRVAGFTHFDVHTTAIAMLGFDKCYLHAFMSDSKICQTTNSNYRNDFCLYASKGMNLRSGNTWGDGGVGITPPTAVNNVDDSNFAAGFEWGTQKTMNVPMVNEIPRIAREVMQGGSLYAHPANFPVGDGVRRLSGNAITGSVELTGDFQYVTQLASLDGFASVAALLAGSQSANRGGGSGTGGGNGGGGATSTMGCIGGRSPGSQVDPVGDFDVTEGVDFEAVPYTDSSLEEGHIYFHEGSGVITISGTLSNVIVVSMGKFKVANEAVLEDVTLISLDDSPGGPDGIAMNGSATIGADDGECNPEGGVKLYAMGSIGGSSGTRWNGALLVAGGSIGMAADASGENGVTAYAAGNIYFTSHNSFNDCGVPKSMTDEMLEAVLVH